MRRHPTHRNQSLFPVLLGVVFCLLISSMGWIVLSLPKAAAKTFGPPAVSFTFFQKLTYSIRLLSHQGDLQNSLDPSAAPQEFRIASGESVNSIALRMEQVGLIRNAAAFRDYLIYSGLDRSIQAGEYQLSAALPAIQLAHALQNASPVEVGFVILAGWRSEEIAASLPTSGLEFTSSEFLAWVERPDSQIFPPGLKNLASLEGYLMPGTYHFRRDVSVEKFLYTILFQFDELLVDDLRIRYGKNGLSLQEAVILASIIQREAVLEEEQPMIASVFYNRLQNGMNLDSDPTVQYAVASPGDWWPNPLTQTDLASDSPYNTYVYPGLPPGPICNPSLSALRAVAYPADSPYFYFRARCDGTGGHSFARTYQEHLENACP